MRTILVYAHPDDKLETVRFQLHSLYPNYVLSVDHISRDYYSQTATIYVWQYHCTNAVWPPPQLILRLFPRQAVTVRTNDTQLTEPAFYAFMAIIAALYISVLTCAIYYYYSTK